MKKQLLLLVMMLSMVVSANALQINGIYYMLNSSDNTAQVTRNYSYTGSDTPSYSGVVDIPEKIVYNNIEYTVTSIGMEAFYTCGELISVNIPNTVVSIGNAAFYFCDELTSVNIPNSVVSRGSEAFYGCRKLTSISIPHFPIRLKTT